MLRVQGLSRAGLHPVSFAVGAGECVALQGSSGAGKSLLLRAMADLDPNVGQVWIDGAARDAMTGPQWRARVGYLPAEPGWWADAVADHFADLERAWEIADGLKLSPTVFERAVIEASTGERQRLALTRALLAEPQALLLDEPTAALDRETTALVEKLLQEFMKRGLAVLLVTHDPAQAERMAARLWRMDHGRLTGPGVT